jgi:hypothetical protein
MPLTYVSFNFDGLFPLNISSISLDAHNKPPNALHTANPHFLNPTAIAYPSDVHSNDCTELESPDCCDDHEFSTSVCESDGADV